MAGLKANQLHTGVITAVATVVAGTIKTSDAIGAQEAAIQSIPAGGTIAITAPKTQLLPIQGSGAAVTASNTPFGTTPPKNGTRIIVIGGHDTNTVELAHNDAVNGCLLVGPAKLKKYAQIEFLYVGAFSRYVEVTRNF